MLLLKTLLFVVLTMMMSSVERAKGRVVPREEPFTDHIGQKLSNVREHYQVCFRVV